MRWRVVLAGGAVIVSTLVAAGPAQALNANSVCRQVTNEARRDAREALGNVNRAFNDVRNENCQSLAKR